CLRSLAFIHRYFGDEISGAFAVGDMTIDPSCFLSRGQVVARYGPDFAGPLRMDSDKAVQIPCLGRLANECRHVDGKEIARPQEAINGVQIDMVCINMIWPDPTRLLHRAIRGNSDAKRLGPDD